MPIHFVKKVPSTRSTAAQFIPAIFTILLGRFAVPVSAQAIAASAVPSALSMSAASGVAAPATLSEAAEVTCSPSASKTYFRQYISALACIKDTGVKDDAQKTDTEKLISMYHLVDTEPPGFFDIGAGFAQIDTAGTTHAAASGMLVTVKAYPMGRWYAPRKQTSKNDTQDKLQKMLKKQSNAAVKNSEQAAAEYEYLEAVRNSLEPSKEFYPLHDAHWIHRFSVFYGRSPGNFNETSVKGAVNAIGIGYDIAPEFALFFGKAYYDELLPSGTTESRQHNIFGVQMNFNAFSAFKN